jgi:hypothetical protein
MARLNKAPHEARSWIGVGRRDITPPFGIYGPVWGSSPHDGSSRGTHKPLYATALSLRASRDDEPSFIVAVDLVTTGDLAGLEDPWLRSEIAAALDIDRSRLMLASSHTHGAPWPYRSRAHLPGGDRIEPYLQQLREAIVEACREADASAVEAILTMSEGRCDLAANRNLRDPDRPERFLTGYNPENQHLADDVVLVGRVARVDDGETLATIVNYACHPTTLGGENRLVSPDYVGRMREVVEAHSGGAPNLFLQGASGDLGPALQYVADPSVADRHGARLGHAAVAALYGMEAPGHALTYAGPIESGAPLAYWEPRPYDVSTGRAHRHATEGLPAKPWPSVEELDAELEQATDPSLRERLVRKRTIAQFIHGRAEVPTDVFAWRFGDIVFVAVSCEVDVSWQKELRAAFPDHAIVAMTDVNYSAIGYVVEESVWDENLYQAWQPPYAKGSFAALLEACKREVRAVVEGVD